MELTKKTIGLIEQSVNTVEAIRNRKKGLDNQPLLAQLFRTLPAIKEIIGGTTKEPWIGDEESAYAVAEKLGTILKTAVSDHKKIDHLQQALINVPTEKDVKLKMEADQLAEAIKANPVLSIILSLDEDNIPYVCNKANTVIMYWDDSRQRVLVVTLSLSLKPGCLDIYEDYSLTNGRRLWSAVNVDTPSVVFNKYNGITHLSDPLIQCCDECLIVYYTNWKEFTDFFLPRNTEFVLMKAKGSK